MPPLAPSPGGRLDLHHGPLVNYVGRQKRVDFSCLAVPVSADGKIEEFFTPFANRLRLDFDPC